MYTEFESQTLKVQLAGISVKSGYKFGSLEVSGAKII